jgi:hypothetical protein
MWFVFGFLTLTICVFASYSARVSARWSPDKREEKYEFKLKKHKGNVTGFLFGVTATQSFEFTVKPEVWYDRFFKKLKVSNEIQTGDIEFDNAFYILADNPLIEKALVSSEVIRNSIKTIFKFGLGNRIRVERLECRDKRLWIKCSCTNQVDESNIGERVAKHILVELSAILKELNNQDVDDYHRWKDPFVYKSLVVLGVSTGLAVNAGIQLFRTWLGDFPFIVNTNTLLLHSILGGFLIVTGLTVFTLYWLKNSSRTHIVLIELLTIGLLGAIGTAFHEMRDANVEWKQSKPEIIVTELQDHYVVKKRRWRSGRGGGGKSIRTTHYYFLLKDWNCQCDKTYEKEVSEELYRRLNYYQYVGIVQYPGALGYKWVSDIKPSNYYQNR